MRQQATGELTARLKLLATQNASLRQQPDSQAATLAAKNEIINLLRASHTHPF